MMKIINASHCLPATTPAAQELFLHNRHGRLRFNHFGGVWTSIASCSSLKRLAVHGKGAQGNLIPEDFLSVLSDLPNVGH